MPARHKASRLRKEQEEDPVDDNEGFVERRDAVARDRRTMRSFPARRRREGVEEMAQRFVHPVLQRAFDGGAVPLAEFNGTVKKRSPAHRAAHGIGAQQSPESCERLLVVDRQLQIEFEEPARSVYVIYAAGSLLPTRVREVVRHLERELKNALG